MSNEFKQLNKQTPLERCNNKAACCFKMVFSLAEIKDELEKREEEAFAVCKSGQGRNINGVLKKTHAGFELFILGVLEQQPELFGKDGEFIDEGLKEHVNSLREITNLKPVIRPFRWWYWFDKAFRFIGVCLGFFTLSMVSILVIVLQIVDTALNSDPFDAMSTRLRKQLVQFLCLVSGVFYDVVGEENEKFEAPCTILAFTHASNLDGILVSSVCPIRHYALAKKELFFVPIFSWISFAIGGVPVDRENKSRAIGALKRTAEAASTSRSCIAIAPEGTRSKSGNILPYKKGLFHMQAQLDAPIVPFIILGAFDLYPVGSWSNICGRVEVKYLDPILNPGKKFTPDEMNNKCRRATLEAILECPDEPYSDVTNTEFFMCYLANIANMYFVASLVKYYSSYCSNYLLLTTGEAIGYTIAGAIALTVILYVYFVYIVDMLNPKSMQKID